MKPSLPRFIYFTTEHGQYILCTEYPFVVGQVWKFTYPEELEEKFFEFIGKEVVHRVEGYNVFIAYSTALVSTFTPKAKYILEMSSFFLSKINERPMGWRRYKIEK